ncbi:glycosyltransferase family 4 protein [Histidinibacterium lentulum]|uniref:glycosyltransferase family 4 protein n=1 Tax=Histidinibacterium lentulum TaxID=2480588 RepID=UPI001607137F|nr:glycosyltransferase family 1 protein [Histidinibacterium lentulum]
MPPRELVLNGRFLTRPGTGVDRVAAELARALAARPDIRLTMALPREALGERSGQLLGPAISRGPLRGHAWEQISLPGLAGGRWCLNLCNTGPLFGVRQVVMLHDAHVATVPGSYSRAFRALYLSLQPRLSRRAAIVLTVSDHSRHSLEATGLVPRGKARVVPNGADHMDRIVADHSVLDRHGLRPRGYFLAVGSAAAYKNIAMIASVADARGAAALPLVTTGGAMPRVFGASPHSGGHRHLGRVTDPELKALYANALALLFPSLAEGFGLPPLEAMSCGTPVIATTAGAVPEVCGGAALHADPSRPSDWRQAMDRIETDADLRRDLRARGRARAAGFTWTRAADRLLAAIAEAEANGA